MDEKIGAEKDIPCFKIMGNSHMVELSAWTAENPSAKAADFPGLPKSYSARRIHQLEKVIEKARNTKKTNWPKFRIKTKPVHNKPGYKKLVKSSTLPESTSEFGDRAHNQATIPWFDSTGLSPNWSTS